MTIDEWAEECFMISKSAKSVSIYLLSTIFPFPMLVFGKFCLSLHSISAETATTRVPSADV
jgi:hypothetical protein